MKISRILFTFLGIFLFSLAGISQSNDLRQKAEEKVAAINEAIVSQDPDLALSPEQREQIINLHIKRTQLIREAKKSDASEEEKSEQIKTAIRDFNQEVNKSILTKKQAKAKRSAAQAAKNE